MSKCLFILFFLQLPIFLFGQIDTVITTAQVEVKAGRVSKISSGSTLQVIDSQAIATQLTSNLTELLATEAGLFFKTYGLGSLGTSTLRGGGAGHTTILWNGFNLQNPMNGVTDFALFPVWLMDKVSLQRGGGSSLQGSGSIGGAVFIEDELDLNAGLAVKLGSSVGSFSDYRQFGNVSLSGERFGAEAKVYHQSATNDFPLPGQSNARQQNADISHWLVSQNNRLKINTKQTLESFLWLQKTGRNIPPSITEANAHARQEDDIARLGLAWTRVGNRAVTKARGSYIDETILFFSDVVDSSESRSRTWTGEVEQAFFMKKNRILRVGVNFTQQQAETRETGDQTRRRTAFFASWQQFFWDEKMAWSTDARQELVDEKLIPTVASSGLDIQWSPAWKSHIRMSRNYNLPTFNDLYWRDAFASGNPDLQAETAMGGELGAGFDKKLNRLSLQTGLTVFSSHVKNWILWAPSGNIWSPENKRTVWARGVEGSLKTRYALPSGDWNFTGHLHASLTRSTVEKIYEEEDPRLLGKQLIYTPVSSAGAGLAVFYKKYQLNYRHQLTGKRYTTTDNREANALPAFQTGSLSLGRPVHFSDFVAHLQFSVFNLWNADYQPIAARPMPGRNFRLEARFEFSTQKDGRK